MKVAFHTLGCKVNQNDTQSLARVFLDKGYRIVPFQSDADIFVINTCSVTGVGEQKSRQTIRKAASCNPEAVIVVTGCYAQTSPQEIADILGVNLVVGMADRPRIVELIEEFLTNRKNLLVVKDISELDEWTVLPAGASGEKTRASLKIEEGCEQFCSYCIVPYARGKVRSMPPPQVARAFREILEQGFREIVLTGIHLGSYGKDLGMTLQTLLRELLQIEGKYRIRLGSIEPLDLDDAFFELIGNNPRVCQYLHIPLQSGCDKILKSMNRGYDLTFYSDLLARIRRINPLIAVGTDLIVGFPGETDADFGETASFVERMGFSRVHVFRFSPRKGTPAAELPNRVPEAEKEKRSKLIQGIADRSAALYSSGFVGKEVEVLFERSSGGFWTGLSGEYLPVKVRSSDDLKNELLRVRISSVDEKGLIGGDISEFKKR